MSLKIYKWSFIERISVQFIQLAIIVLTSRFITPEQFGVFGLSAIVVSIAQVFVDSGFSAALIRKNTHSQAELSSVFIINIFISLICVLLIVYFSTYAESYFNVRELGELASLSSTVVVINAFVVVPKVILTIKLDFKSQANASLVAVICSGFISVYLAVNGYGAFALVIQFISYNLINAVLLAFKSKWLPSFVFDFPAVSELSNFSLKLLLSGLIDALYQNLYLVFIGRIMSVYEVGIFSQGKRLSDIPALTITNALQRANLAAIGRLTSDSEIRQYTLQSLKLGMFLMAPSMFLLGCISLPLINLLLGMKWAGVAPIMAILSISGIFYPLHVLNQNILIIKGRSGLHLKLEIFKKILGITLIIFTISHGLKWLCTGIFFHALLSVFINAYYTFNLSGITLTSQIKTCVSPIVISVLGAFLSIALRDLPFMFTEQYFYDIKDIIISFFSFLIVFSILIPVFHHKELKVYLKKFKDKG